MYLSFYNLREYPFSMGCEERFFFESAIHSEALANMLYTFQQRKGMVLITGEVGAGKTFVGNMLASRLGPGCLTVMVKSPPQSGKQLLRAVATGVGMDVDRDADKLSLVNEVNQHLLRMHSRGRLVALVLDECQDLARSSLEEIRLLWNWEEKGQRLLQILLIGQPEMRDKLLEPKWESLRQRIVLSYHLGHLSAEDMAAYIAHRLRVAAGGELSSAEFAPDGIEAIFAATNGIPRLVNVLCDNALLVAYSRGVYGIGRDIIMEVLRDMTCWGLRTPNDASPLASAPIIR